MLAPAGVGLLLRGPPLDILRVTAAAFVGIAALACGVQGWMFGRTTWLERLMLLAAGLLLVYPGKALDVVGIALAVAAVVMQRARRRRASHRAG